MISPPDRPRLPRNTVCDLAGAERARHGRWQKSELLARKDVYGRVDVIRAAALNHLWATLGPSRANLAWRQLQTSIGLPSAALDVVFDPATRVAELARSPEELSRLLPRDRQVMVVDLGPGVRRADERLDAYLTARRPSTSGPSAAKTHAAQRTGSEPA